MPYYFTLVGGLIVTLIFIFRRSLQGATKQNLFLKMVSSLCYLLTMVFACITQPHMSFFPSFLIMGGVLGLCGDTALDLKYIYPQDSNSYLKAGFVFFLVGHVFYSAAIVWQMKFKWWWVLICAVIAVCASIINLLSAKISKLDFGKYKSVVFIYSCFLFLTAATSICAVIQFKSASMILFAVGSVLFLLSDLVLSFTYFGKGWDKPVHIFVNHALYYAAQYLIAASIIFI